MIVHSLQTDAQHWLVLTHLISFWQLSAAILLPVWRERVDAITAAIEAAVAIVESVAAGITRRVTAVIAEHIIETAGSRRFAVSAIIVSRLEVTLDL